MTHSKVKMTRFSLEHIQLKISTHIVSELKYLLWCSKNVECLISSRKIKDQRADDHQDLVKQASFDLLDWNILGDSCLEYITRNEIGTKEFQVEMSRLWFKEIDKFLWQVLVEYLVRILGSCCFRDTRIMNYVRQLQSIA